MSSHECHGVLNNHKFDQLCSSLVKITTSKYVMTSQWPAMHKTFPCADVIMEWALLVFIHHVDGSVQNCSNFSALTMELPQSCTRPSMYYKLFITAVIADTLAPRLSLRRFSLVNNTSATGRSTKKYTMLRPILLNMLQHGFWFRDMVIVSEMLSWHIFGHGHEF